MGAEFTFLGQQEDLAHGCNKLLVLDSKQTSRHVNFAERHVNSKAISRQARRHSLLAAATARRRLGGPHFVLATRTLMTPHSSQTKADAKGKRRRGETKPWHAQRWAPPPRRRRRQGRQRERLDQLGGWGERRVPPVAQYMNRRAHLHAKQAKPRNNGSESPRRPRVPVHTATAVFLGKTRE